MSGGSIEIRDMVARRGSFLLRVDELHIEPHEIFAIVGETGAGKTVLLEAIAGAFPLEAGSILLDGKDIRCLPVQQRRLGIVYQDHALFPHMTVAENIGYGLRMARVPKAEAARRVEEMLDLFSIRHIADRYPGIISGGEGQRAALARVGDAAGDLAARRAVLGARPHHQEAHVRDAARRARPLPLHRGVRHA